MKPSPLIVREFPAAECAFLRVQVGRVEQRPERRPDGTAAGDLARVFHLLGFGASAEAADRMARKSLAHYGT